MECSLEDEIEFTREAMAAAAVKEGLSANETLELSRKLDGLMNKFEVFKTNSCSQDCHTRTYEYDNF